MGAAKKRGAPTKAAQTIEEAVAAVAAGTAPKRPRNEVERIAGYSLPGRKQDRSKPVWQAAQLAKDLHDGGVDRNVAAKQAAKDWGVHYSNVLRYLRKLDPKTVLVSYTGPVSPFPTPTAQELPFCTIVDVPTDTGAA